MENLPFTIFQDHYDFSYFELPIPKQRLYQIRVKLL